MPHPTLHLDKTQHQYSWCVLATATPASGDAGHVDLSLELRDPTGLANHVGMHACIIVQTDDTNWEKLNKLKHSELADMWAKCDEHFTYLIDETTGNPTGVAIKGPHPESLRGGDTPGTWTHVDGQTISLMVHPYTISSGGFERNQQGNTLGGREFRILVFAEDRVAYPELICVTEAFRIMSRSTLDKSPGKQVKLSPTHVLNYGPLIPPQPPASAGDGAGVPAAGLQAPALVDAGGRARGAVENGVKWLPEEDCALLDVAKMYTAGGRTAWKQVEEELHRRAYPRAWKRTLAMCRNRYQRIQAPLKVQAPLKEGKKQKRCTYCQEPVRGHTCTVGLPAKTEETPVTEEPSAAEADRCVPISDEIPETVGDGAKRLCTLGEGSGNDEVLSQCLDATLGQCLDRAFDAEATGNEMWDEVAQNASRVRELQAQHRKLSEQLWVERVERAFKSEAASTVSIWHGDVLFKGF